MDTVRADHMSLYGYPRPTTPELERWAGEGITFEMARSAAPWTLPSHVTMFTGLWPFEHGARIDRPYFGPPRRWPSICGRTATPPPASSGNTGMCNATYGLGRGFDYYVELLCNHEVSLQAAMFNSSLGASVMKLANAIGLPVPGKFPQARPSPGAGVDRPCPATGWATSAAQRGRVARLAPAVLPLHEFHGCA